MAALGLQRPQHSYSQSPRMSQSQHAPQSQSQPESQSQSQSGAADKENYDSVSGGWIMSMKLENFMCHKNLEVEFIPRVNFITGQNGSKAESIRSYCSGSIRCGAAPATPSRRPKLLQRVLASKGQCPSILLRPDCCFWDVPVLLPRWQERHPHRPRCSLRITGTRHTARNVHEGPHQERLQVG